MRLDRMVTLYLTRPLVEMGVVSGERAVPVLMYHGISDDHEPGVSPYYKTNTSPAVFEQQMRTLAEQGFRSVTVDEAARIQQQNRAEKIVVITFDDGFRDFYDLAFPILKKLGHTATMFLPTAFISDSRRKFKGKECMTWQEVRTLKAQGIQFGAHTVNHPKLYQLPWKEIETELALSKEQIEQELGERVTGFAYPYAFPQEDRRFTKTLGEMLRGQGYRNCHTTVVGRVRPNDDPFFIKRLPVNSCDDQALLAAKLKGAYDWLSIPQVCVRRTRAWAKGGRAQTSLNLA